MVQNRRKRGYQKQGSSSFYVKILLINLISSINGEVKPKVKVSAPIGLN